MDFNNIEVSKTLERLKQLFDNENTVINYVSEHRFDDPHQNFDNAKAGHKNFYYELVNAMETYRGIAANPMTEQHFINWHNHYELEEIQRNSRMLGAKEQMIGHVLFVSASFHIPANFKKPTVELNVREMVFAESPSSEKIAYPYQYTSFIVARYSI